jgi:hypothetical protein
MIRLTNDMRFAFRRFRRVPGPLLAAIVTLTLGIGANTAIFSLVDGISLRPLPIADPTHLVGIESVKNHAETSENVREADFKGVIFVGGGFWTVPSLEIVAPGYPHPSIAFGL